MKLHTPTLDELWFKEELLADHQTMSYNHAYGGTIPFPREKLAAWYDRWIVHHENKRFTGTSSRLTVHSSVKLRIIWTKNVGLPSPMSLFMRNTADAAMAEPD